MDLEYFDTTNVSHLIDEFFYLQFNEDDVPFESTVLPICNTSITFIYNNHQSILFNKKVTSIKNLVVTGQFYQSYKFLVKGSGRSFGMSLHPTALYKLTKSDVSFIQNKHVSLNSFSENLYNQLNPLFVKYQKDIPQLIDSLRKIILKIPGKQDSTVKKIDRVIEYIHIKEGMLNTYELLNIVDFSQKSLETHFKKIIGLTPGKYIRLYRFLKLMRKYESKSIELKDLIYMYDYYDHSHFSKDFKYFMKQSPKDYFKIDHPFLNKYLKK